MQASTRARGRLRAVAASSSFRATYISAGPGPTGDDPIHVMKRSIFAVLAAVALNASPADSQAITSPYDFVENSMAVWGFGSAVFTDRGPLDVGPGSGYAAGLGFTIRVNGPFNFDTRLAYLPTSRRVFDVEPSDSVLVREDPTVGINQIGTADLDLLLLDASLRFDVTGPRTWYRLQPYALIGAGAVLRIASDNSAEEAIEEDSDILVRFRNGFTGHVGAGVEWHLSDRLTLRADARNTLWKVHLPDGFFVDGRIVTQEEWVQSAHLSLGLGFRF